MPKIAFNKDYEIGLGEAINWKKLFNAWYEADKY